MTKLGERGGSSTFAVALSVFALVVACMTISIAVRKPETEGVAALEARIVVLEKAKDTSQTSDQQIIQGLGVLRAEILRGQITEMLMAREVEGMRDEELALLLRTSRYEEAAEELGNRRAAALKAAGKKVQPKK